jgi:GT2 family glycosyltransferase
VHWGDPAHLVSLFEAWPRDEPGVEMLVVDNAGSGPPPQALPPRTRWMAPGRNLGFAGGVDLALRHTTAPIVLLLNPDARPEPGALASLVAGLAEHPRAAGLAPRLVGSDGAPQHRWQLRPLPRARDLVGQALFLPVPHGPHAEPSLGARVAQPAAAVLALRREVLVGVGGLDAAYYPAWFEDVDLARRLEKAGHEVLYWPRAVFRHGLGGSVGSLGYGPFLWIYSRNLVRYARAHHGAALAATLRALLPVAALARGALLVLRRPRHARSRLDAARGLLALVAGAASGWTRPRSLAARFAPPVGTEPT